MYKESWPVLWIRIDAISFQSTRFISAAVLSSQVSLPTVSRPPQCINNWINLLWILELKTLTEPEDGCTSFGSYKLGLAKLGQVKEWNSRVGNWKGDFRGFCVSSPPYQPTAREGDGDGEQGPFAAVAHGEAAERAAEQGAQQRQAGDPRSFLRRHGERSQQSLGARLLVLLLVRLFVCVRALRLMMLLISS